MTTMGDLILGEPGSLVFERSRWITLWDLAPFGARRGISEQDQVPHLGPLSCGGENQREGAESDEGEEKAGFPDRKMKKSSFKNSRSTRAMVVMGWAKTRSKGWSCKTDLWKQRHQEGGSSGSKMQRPGEEEVIAEKGP